MGRPPTVFSLSTGGEASVPWTFVEEARLQPDYPAYDCPAAIVHGLQDEVVPVAVTKSLVDGRCAIKQGAVSFVTLSTVDFKFPPQYCSGIALVRLLSPSLNIAALTSCVEKRCNAAVLPGGIWGNVRSRLSWRTTTHSPSPQQWPLQPRRWLIFSSWTDERSQKELKGLRQLTTATDGGINLRPKETSK